MPPFEPLFKNPHVMTVLANFWPRNYDHARFPMESRLVRTDADTQVRVESQRPEGKPQGHLILLHGLEGHSEAGYIVSMAWEALNAGFAAHRFNMRTCGGTAHLAKTLYHGGLTSDVRTFLEGEKFDLPVFLIGYSLGGNIALKLAGELGETDLIHGVCAVSTPIDLAAGVRRISQRDNRIYEVRFIRRMKERLLQTGRYTSEQLAPLNTIFEMDDKIIAPAFGFENAQHYYRTQSCQNFLDRIRVPSLLITAKDDSFIPFEIYSHPAIRSNPLLRLVATEHGGHLGFLNRHAPRFWTDHAAIEFLQEVVASKVSSASAR
jgi:predicted alpha/beta-fold hydrolase